MVGEVHCHKLTQEAPIIAAVLNVVSLLEQTNTASGMCHETFIQFQRSLLIVLY